MTSYDVGWIRQKPGRALEWIGWMSTGSNSALASANALAKLCSNEEVFTSVESLYNIEQ